MDSKVILAVVGLLVIAVVVYFAFFWETQIVITYDVLNVSQDFSCKQYALGSIVMSQAMDSAVRTQCHNVCDRISMNSKGFSCNNDNLMVCRCGFLG